MTYINYMFQQRVPKHLGVYVCRVLYYEVHLLDDILMTLRQYSSGETGENNENCKPSSSGVPRGSLGCSTPPPEIPKALQNRAKLNPTVKTVKNCWI